MIGLTISEMAEILRIEKNTVLQRLYVAKIKPLTKEAIYPKSALETIRNVPGKGRPKDPVVKQVLKAQESYRIAIIAGDTRVKEKETIFISSLLRFSLLRKDIPQNEIDELLITLDPEYARLNGFKSFAIRGVDGNFSTFMIGDIDNTTLTHPKLARKKPNPKKSKNPANPEPKGKKSKK